MSLVGPRPAIFDEVEKYSARDFGRLSAKPGLTCFWQVEGRSSLPFSKQVELDLKYVEQMGLKTDLKLIAKTLLR